MSARVPNGNICLTFNDQTSQQFTQFAARHFSSVADGYLIGADGVPHITICQIHHDKSQPRAFRRDLETITAAPEPFKLDAMTQRAGTDAHAGYTWLELKLPFTPEWLADLKFDVETLLRNYDITSLTSYGPDYSPHITLCRVKSTGKPVNAAPNIFTIEPNQLRLSLTSCDEQGRVQKIFRQKPLT